MHRVFVCVLQQTVCGSVQKSTYFASLFEGVSHRPYDADGWMMGQSPWPVVWLIVPPSFSQTPFLYNKDRIEYENPYT